MPTMALTCRGRAGGGAGVANVKAICGGCSSGLMAWMAVRMASESGIVASGLCGSATPQKKNVVIPLFCQSS